MSVKRLTAVAAIQEARRHCHGGFTLPELMVGVTVSTLVLIGISAAYLLSTRASTQAIQQARVNQEMRALVEFMARDIKRAGYWAYPASLATAPTQNPFQKTLGGINHDLRIGAVTGEDPGTCLLYSYDSDRQGKIGICAADESIPCAQPQSPFNDPLIYDLRPNELFGFRLINQTVEVRRARSGNSDTTFGCDSGRWDRLTSTDLQISTLRFTVTPATTTTPATTNLNPDKLPTAECASGDVCRTIRSVEIEASGRLAPDHSVSQTLSATVAVSNDLYVQIP